jgi:hypothetical protein
MHCTVADDETGTTFGPAIVEPHGGQYGRNVIVDEEHQMPIRFAIIFHRAAALRMRNVLVAFCPRTAPTMNQKFARLRCVHLFLIHYTAYLCPHWPSSGVKADRVTQSAPVLTGHRY